MSEEQKSPSLPTSESTCNQDPQQVQALLKQALKENKTLQNKNSKLQSKYVELFKQNKLLKQDRTTLISFVLSLFLDGEGKPLLQEPALGQTSLQQLNALQEQISCAQKNRVQELSSKITSMEEQHRIALEKQLSSLAERLNSQWSTRIKGAKEQQNKQAHIQQRQIDSLKKSLELRNSEIGELKNALEARTQELSRISKEKLKMEHHLNNIRKKQISKEITPPQEPDQTKTLIDKNQYLSLRQQVETLMAKRDQLRKQLKKKEQELEEQQKMSHNLQKQLQRLTTIQRQCDEKYELVRQCSLEDLENMIVSYGAPQVQEYREGSKQVPEVQREVEEHSTEEQIQREYLKNMVIRYVKAQTSGNIKQAMTLLEIIGRLVKLQQQTVQALNQYMSRRNQWWLIKY